MNIALIYPYFLNPRIHLEEIASPPLGLYYIAAMLKHHGYTVQLLNLHDAGGQPRKVKQQLQLANPDIIGISVLHANRWGAIEIASQARRINPGIKIVLGGVGATFLWEHLLTHFSDIDAVVLGEGEQTFLELVRHYERPTAHPLQHIQGIAYGHQTGPKRTAPRPPIEDLDQLPDPARYFNLQHVAATRGCPGKCTFCGSPQFWGTRVRRHSAHYFVDQLQVLAQRGSSFVWVSDDTFTLHKRYTLEICHEIKHRGLNLEWAAISRVDAVDAERLYWMRRAGCVQISYGIESGAPDIRRRLNKHFSDDQIAQAFELTRQHGILPRAYFIYGGPGETDDTIRQTIDLVRRIKPLAAIFYVMDLFPGTALFEHYLSLSHQTDDLWLQRIEDILYYETDDQISAQQVLNWGQQLRSAFHQGLARFTQDIDLLADPELAPQQADFLSRLGLTFSQGDYSRLPEIRNPEQVAKSLFDRALGLAPDQRAFLGRAILHQKIGHHTHAISLLKTGLQIFPNSEHLNICLAVSLMNLGRFEMALSHLTPFDHQPHVQNQIETCRKALSSSK